MAMTPSGTRIRPTIRPFGLLTKSSDLSDRIGKERILRAGPATIDAITASESSQPVEHGR